MKPVETGCRVRRNSLLPQDAQGLVSASGADDPLDLVNPYRFRAPVAPLVAAEQEGRTIAVSRIMAAYRELRRRHDFLIVEGAGGIMVPLSRRTSYLDLAEAMGLPVLVVARPDLGTINHTVLTVMALRSRNIPVSGIVVNFSRKTARTLAVRTNPDALEQLTGIRVFTVPHGCRDLSPFARSLR
jgi:dethiobiotin synthetase